MEELKNKIEVNRDTISKVIVWHKKNFIHEALTERWLTRIEEKIWCDNIEMNQSERYYLEMCIHDALTYSKNFAYDCRIELKDIEELAAIEMELQKHRID